jgi:signal transduction histidine kinase
VDVDPTQRFDGAKHRGGLVDFIRARPERVLEQWEAADRVAKGFAEALRDHVGELLLRVTAHMERGRGAFLLEGISLRAQPAEIAAELSLLRTAVFDAWIDDGGGALDAEEVVRLGRAVDALLAAALAAWSDGVVRREVTTGETTRPRGLDATQSVEGPRVDAAEAVRVVDVVGRELRAPLHAIAFSMAKLLEDHDLPDVVRTGMQKTARGAERMVDKIDEVLDFAKVRLDGELPITRRSVNLIDVARAVLEREDAAPGARRSRLRAEGDTTGLWDRDCVAQMIARLVSNARRHGDVGAVEVCVRGADEHVEIVVENRGDLDDDAMQHLFQPLVPVVRGKRAKDTDPPGAQQAQRGVGLGLFLVQAAARAHGGTVSASSALGRTTFVVRLPRAPW